MTLDEFEHALSIQAEASSVLVAGARIAFRRWPKAGAQGLLLIHGHAAHARWWDHLAPALNTVFDVSAIDLSGSGDSDHRDFYSSTLFAAEMMQVTHEAGYSSPIIVAHSFGGTLARMACFLNPGWTKNLILIDSVISGLESKSRTVKPPAQRAIKDETNGTITPRKPQRRYRNRAEAIRRFRVRPRQSIEHDHIARHIAHHSIKHQGNGYQFKFDRDLLKKFILTPGLPRGPEMIAALTATAYFIYGKRSQFFDVETDLGAGHVKTIEALIPASHIIPIENAAHHVFLDQPKATIHALLSFTES